MRPGSTVWVRVALATVGLTMFACSAEEPTAPDLSSPLQKQPPSLAGASAPGPLDIADGESGNPTQAGVQEPAVELPPPDQSPATPVGAPSIPCDVAQVVASECGNCHGEETNWGAPMQLLSHEDFHRAAPLTKGRIVHELAAERIADEARPMPPQGLSAPEVIEPLRAWLATGAPVGSAADAACVVQANMDQEPGAPVGPESGALGNEPPEGATCYQLLNHGGNTVNDTPYMVQAAETYVEFYFEVPWTEEVAAINWRTVYDNTAVLHHWLLYAGTVAAPLGSSTPSTGSHIGQNIELVAAWAVGGNDVKPPEGIAMEMPPPGKHFLIEWHFFNQTGQSVPDRSGVEVCVVPKASLDPKKIGGLTWLGTENLNNVPLGLGMQAGVESKFSGTCLPSRTGLGPEEPITIFAWFPHMHLLGTHMDTVVNRIDGSSESVFSKSFQFDRQLTYGQDPLVQMFSGDTITSTCTFFNDTPLAVAFGPQTTQEMCYQFAFSYPARALPNGVPSLNGSTNTCW